MGARWGGAPGVRLRVPACVIDIAAGAGVTPAPVPTRMHITLCRPPILPSHSAPAPPCTPLHVHLK